MPRPRTPDELDRALDTQVRALRASSEAFDAGERWEALRLATAAFTLVNDGGRKSQSLLTQMGVKQKMMFLASGSPVDEANLISSLPLTMFRFGGEGPAVVPKLAKGPPGEFRWVRFGEWWERDLIYRSDDGKHTVTRRKLVFTMRNQEGGSHYDPVLKDDAYADLAAGGGWLVGTEDETFGPPPDVELAMMRQIAWELMQSLERAGHASN